VKSASAVGIYIKGTLAGEKVPGDKEALFASREWLGLPCSPR